VRTAEDYGFVDDETDESRAYAVVLGRPGKEGDHERGLMDTWRSRKARGPRLTPN
jgi:hypothetical protein